MVRHPLKLPGSEDKDDDEAEEVRRRTAGVEADGTRRRERYRRVSVWAAFRDGCLVGLYMLLSVL